MTSNAPFVRAGSKADREIALSTLKGMIKADADLPGATSQAFRSDLLFANNLIACAMYA